MHLADPSLAVIRPELAMPEWNPALLDADGRVKPCGWEAPPEVAPTLTWSELKGQIRALRELGVRHAWFERCEVAATDLIRLMRLSGLNVTQPCPGWVRLEWR